MQSRISLPPFVKVNFDVVISEEKVCIATIGKNHTEKSFLCWAKILEDQEPLIAEGWKLRLLILQLKSEKAVESGMKLLICEGNSLSARLFQLFGPKKSRLTTQTVTFISASQILSFFKKHFLTTFTKHSAF